MLSVSQEADFITVEQSQASFFPPAFSLYINGRLNHLTAKKTNFPKCPTNALMPSYQQ